MGVAIPRQHAAVVLVPNAAQPDADDLVAADAGVSAAYGTDALPPVREQRAVMARAVLLARRFHARVLAPSTHSVIIELFQINAGNRAFADHRNLLW